MIVALLAALFSLFFGSDDSPFIIPKAEKHIIQVIEDKGRKKEAKAIIKTFNKDWKILKKASKKQTKQIILLNKDFTTEQEQFELVFELAKKERVMHAENLIDTRLKLQALLTEKEWTELIKKTSSFIEKKDKKVSKKEIKAGIKQNKQLTAIRQDILISVSEVYKEEATTYFDSFEDALAAHVYANRDYAENLFLLTENKNSSKEDIEVVVMEMEEFRSTIGLSFIELRYNLLKLSDKNDWSKISKSLAKLIN